jgi:RimJ/RimL family protein N-acetyltransferase
MNYSVWKGEKVRLRAIESEDIENFIKYGDDEINRNLGGIHFPHSDEEIKSWIEKEKKKEEDSYRWIIEDISGNLVGTINTFECNRRFGTFKYALVIYKPFWGKGYAQEAIKIVLKHYFFEMCYQKVTPHVFSFNDRSLKLHEKLGFKREGQLRNMYYTNGSYHDEIYFGMTKEEFNEKLAK